jgi:protein DJ-1
MGKKRVLVVLAPGAEEMETVIVVDVLRRGELEVVLAGLDGEEPVTCSRGVTIVPDVALAQARGPFDAIVLPGGAEGARRLAASPLVARLLREQEAAQRTIGAICAAPSALARHDLGKGRRMTSHPSVREAVAAHARYEEQEVVEDGPYVTSRGPGTALAFALALVGRLTSRAQADALRAPMMLAPV